jgi:rhodanese-related sulfurtransferase
MEGYMLTRRGRTVLAIVAVFIGVAACSAPKETGQAATATPGQAGGGSYQTLTIDAFAEILATHKNEYTIINVHTPYEGEIDGTDAKIPYDDLDALMAALPDKNAPIILYCRSGRMSQIASRALSEKGYTRIWDVPGGMIAWEASGHSIVKK